jgi:phosphohistidine swiveling domain-containing protein
MTTAPETLAPQPIEAPSEFPVAWDQPGDEMLMWEQDRAHASRQLAPLDYELMFDNFMRGMTFAFRHYGIPIKAVLSRRINTYFYSATVPEFGPPEEMAAKQARAEENVGRAMASVGELWRDELLPEVQRNLDVMASRDVAMLTDADLHSVLQDTIDRGRRLAEIHMQIVFPAYLAVSEFEELYNELFSPEDKFEAHRLLQGLPNKTVEFGHELWKLSRSARWSPGVMEVLDHEPADRAVEALRRANGGRPFLAELTAYLQVYGHRASIWGLAGKTWIEDPTPVIKNLKDYTQQPDSESPIREFERLAAEREEAIAAARERLAGYPGPVRDQFELMLKAAQEGIVISEDHGFYIDSAGLAQIRRVLLEAGRRLAIASAINHHEDVFMLTVKELLDGLADPAGSEYIDAVAERYDEMERYADIIPPLTLGSMPPGPPPESAMTRLMAKFSGAPVAPSENSNEVRGSAGSSGKVVGIARVVSTLEDAARIQPGEILVAPTTAPPWTPLFASVAAVVTNSGGMLSHCAVVAREYAIPAVVGTGNATSAIADGQTIEVDGDAGVVRILDSL